MIRPIKSPTVARPPRPRIPDFRAAIAQALEEGANIDSLVLRLTLRDEAELKRNPSVGTDEISFRDGKMRFLGVTVVSGGIAESTLERGEAAS